MGASSASEMNCPVAGGSGCCCGLAAGALTWPAYSLHVSIHSTRCTASQHTCSRCACLRCTPRKPTLAKTRYTTQAGGGRRTSRLLVWPLGAPGWGGRAAALRACRGDQVPRGGHWRLRADLTRCGRLAVGQSCRQAGKLSTADSLFAGTKCALSITRGAQRGSRLRYKQLANMRRAQPNKRRQQWQVRCTGRQAHL